MDKQSERVLVPVRVKQKAAEKTFDLPSPEQMRRDIERFEAKMRRAQP